MGELLVTYVSILPDMIRPLKFESKDKVCCGRRAEQHVCKINLVISLIVSQAEQYHLSFGSLITIYEKINATYEHILAEIAMRSFFTQVLTS